MDGDPDKFILSNQIKVMGGEVYIIITYDI